MHNNRNVTRPKGREARPGFSLSEVIIGLGLAAVVILTLLALGISTIQANRKSTDTMLGQWVNELELERLLHDSQTNAVSVVWGPSPPVIDKTVACSNIDFRVQIYITDVDKTAFPAPHRFRKIQAITQWWGADKAGRQGMGQLKAESTAYVHQP